MAAQIDGAQGGCWGALLHPLAFLVMLIAIFAESNRAPFDLAEAEQELVGGYHTEYSALKFGLFFLAEYAHMLTASAVVVVLFLGGWELFPFSWKLGWAWLDWLHNAPVWTAALLRVSIVCGKIVLVIFVYMWVRWTLPRFRFDQLMRLAWKGLIPIGLATAALTIGLVYAGRAVSIWAPVGNAVILAAMVVWVALPGRELTGRQRHLPAVGPKAGTVG